MVLRQGREIKPINFPKRRNIAIRDTRNRVHRQLAPELYQDPRHLEQKKFRLDFEAEANGLQGIGQYKIVSPENQNITIDSADEVLQVYTLPPGHNFGCQALRPIVDYVNNILITYHFDRQNLRYVKFITRLRKDATFPQPPAGQFNANYLPYFGSRGTRYIRTKRSLAVDPKRRRSVSNRTYRGGSGVSGARGDLGAFRGGLR